MNANNIEVHQMDVDMAFLNTLLTDEIYIMQPQGFINTSQPDHVCCLYKSLYGLKQSPYKWNKTFNNHLHTSSFEPADLDLCIYIQ
ncbi:retrotransposon RIRE1 poly protein, putative [Acanthamoeba castellanii str. Neff]|uniref:Retrotransposon RIRE1 poly protein, putative n=1 Tax=Acanthamoeba castellanii (strain ATCC 30010 / Neff) TaxID=1257118 RepID=L8GUU0_ACACF|nr:retrotransposon RIRE1 poly protein, putative [Acanthamoeba castellanii str. Neff]ELR16765.1 retrotransposon RIRE1 poly protein, putative [Acanthamoeba castellanii str. Neff]